MWDVGQVPSVVSQIMPEFAELPKLDANNDRQRAEAQLAYIRIKKSDGTAKAVAWYQEQSMEWRTALAPFVDMQSSKPDNDDGGLPELAYASLQSYEIHKNGDKDAVYGIGGMGVVLKGRERILDRPVAIKILKKSQQLITARETKQFFDEARAQASIKHSGVPTVYAFGRDNNLNGYGPFIVMEAIEGPTLRVELSSKSGRDRGVVWVTDVILDICEPMAFAHNKNLYHLDLKAKNVMFTLNNEVKLTDWGLSQKDTQNPDRIPDAAAGSENSHQVNSPGTFSHMAPEQANGQKIDEPSRTDVFLLGGTLCEILTGKAPYEREVEDNTRTRDAARTANLDDAFRRLMQCPPEFSTLVEIAQKCLQVEPKDRYLNAMDVAKELSAFRDSLAERATKAEADRAAAFERAVAQTKYAEAEANSNRRLQGANRRLQGANRHLQLAIGIAVIVAVFAGSQWIKAKNAVVALYASLTDTASVTATLGSLADERGSKQQAETALREAVKLFERLTLQYPENHIFRLDLAKSRLNLGALRWERGDPDGALILYKASLDDISLQHKFPPQNMDLPLLTANIHSNIGNLHLRSGRYQEAEDSYKQSEVVRNKHAELAPEDPERRLSMAKSDMDFGHLYQDISGRAAEAVERQLETVLATISRTT
jgi:tetratricopeptide (TPR) repeat protein